MSASLNRIELKNGDDPADVVTKALGELKESVDGRLKAIETKSANAAKVTDRLDKIEAKLNRPVANDNNDATDETKKLETKAFGKFLRSGREALGADEVKSLITGDDPRGGYVAPPQMSTDIIRLLTQFSPVRAAARVGQTANPSVILPVRTAITNALWEGETETETESDPAFGQVEIPVFGLKTYTDVSVQLLEDAAIDLQAELNLALAEDFGKKEGTAFVNGTGVKQPRGIMVHPSVQYVPGGDASNLTANGLIDVFHALPPAYRGVGAWMMNSTTVGAVRKLVTSTGAPLWVDSLAAGNPATILGRPVIEAIDMPDVAGNAFPIVFGDFNSAYRIYDRVSLVLLRDPFTQATNGLVRFHARRRVGGDVAKPEAIRKLKIATS
ncbi:MAG TPA: phage major capsid protein [Candidatus Dormibacteraeota bacterium]|nr:phage major capsid protein [Candidatus Dormibacteraeota bacterium]